VVSKKAISVLFCFSYKQNNSFTRIARQAGSPFDTRSTASPVIMEPLLTGEKESICTLPPGDDWKNAETASALAVKLRRE
jgi:hypothetical protein